MTEQILSDRRLINIRKAIAKWYEAQTQRALALRLLGRSYNHGEYRRWMKKRAPPLQVIYGVYKITKDAELRLTRQEKETYRRRLNTKSVAQVNLAILDYADWPDRELEEELTSTVCMEVDSPGIVLEELIGQIQAATAQLDQLGKLPEDNAVRKKARQKLVGPAMLLFEALTRLSLEFPREFEDLLDALGVVNNVFAKGQSHE